MKTIQILIFCSLLGLPAIGGGTNNAVDNLLEKANAAKEDHKDRQAIEYYEKILDIDSTNFAALWNVSYLYSRLGWLEKKKEKKQKLYKKSIRYAKRTYKKYPNTYEANLVMAGTIARMSEFASPKERVHFAWDIKEYADAAIKIDTNNPDIWYLLGWWNFEISKANWLERSLAKIFFGGLPKGTSFDLAIKHLKKAIELKPNYIVYLYDLATFYEKTDNPSAAIDLCKKALVIEPSAPEDTLYLDKCQSLYERLTN